MRVNKESKRITREGKEFSWEEREAIVKEYLSSGLSRRAIWEKHTGQEAENGQLLRWLKLLGYEDVQPKKRLILEKMKRTDPPFDEGEKRELLERIKTLESRLDDATLKAEAYSSMIDLAEKEFNISIRKKSGTKPSNR